MVAYFKKISLALGVLLSHIVCAQQVIHYELFIKDSLVQFAGKPKRAIAVNGQIPMPALTFTQGDTAEIVVHNQLKESTSLHWHGLFLPNKEDGVPYLTQMPIKPGETFTYRFPILQFGTHWYHSHSGMQEQLGMYGSLTLLKKENDSSFRKGIDDLPAFPLVLSEWTNLDPDNIHRMLHNANDWFALKKNSVQSYGEALKAGHFKTKLVNEWKRMLAMDVSDVFYDKFLINGENGGRLTLQDGFAGAKKVRLRVSNGGASSYFWLTYAGGKITLVANDGNDVEPVDVDRLIIGVSETYDIIVELPEENTAYEFLATPEDRTKSTSVFIGDGIVQLKSRLPRLDYFEGMKMMNEMMNMDGSLDDMGMQMSLQKMDMNVVMYSEITGSQNSSKKKSDDANEKYRQTNPFVTTLNYSKLKATNVTTLPVNAPTRTFRFELSGNMNRYVWSMDNKVLSEVDKIEVKKGENLRIVLYNGSMMRHPIHLHGHDFRVINGQGNYAPLKNVVDIMPMETDTLEFNANLEGDWFFHCHILYHMMAGMNRVFSYQNQAPNPYLPKPDKAYRILQRESNQFHFMAENDLATNGDDGMMMLQNTRWSLSTEWRLGYHDMHGYESETHFGRYFGRMQWFMPFIGYDWRYRKFGIDEREENFFGQSNTKDLRSKFSVGIDYVLPMLFHVEGELFTDGIVRFQLHREDIPIAKRVRMGLMINTDKEYMAGFKYVLAKNFALSTHYDSDMGWGIGINMNY
jgi:FtsP/CotA-like multicopper oxidase with cupredoxin domain